MNAWETTDNFIFTVNLKSSDAKMAKELSKNKLTTAKAQEFYYNVLAAVAVQDYLEIIGYETKLHTNDFEDPVISTLAEVIDLEIENYGNLECRAVLGEGDIYISEDDSSDTIGYVFVGIDTSLEEASIFGFLPSVKETEGVVYLDRLQSLADFPEYLSDRQQQQLAKQTINKSLQLGVTKLGDWLKEARENIGKEWQNVEDLFAMPSQNLSYLPRVSSSYKVIKKAKLVDLKVNLASRSVILLMTVIPTPDKLKVRARLCPVSGEKYLPADLKLEILSESSESLRSVKSEERDYFIELKEFTCNFGDRFKLSISLGDANVVEEFAI